jgi:hypothetical protein
LEKFSNVGKVLKVVENLSKSNVGKVLKIVEK